MFNTFNNFLLLIKSNLENFFSWYFSLMFNWFNSYDIKFYFFYFVNSLCIFIFILLSVALFTVFERKTMASLQKRKGPNVHGFLGFLQAFADGLKLFLKEDIALKVSSLFIFRFSPIFSLFISFLSWSVMIYCYFCGLFSSQMGILFMLAFSSLFVYGIILGGWSSNSTYAFLGALRSTAQMISYEVSIAFILLTLTLFLHSLDFVIYHSLQTILYLGIPFFFLALVFFICLIAETNRAPFDLPEAEAELVSGYNVEYGGMSFAFFFLAEYCSIILMITFFVILLLGSGWPFLGWWFGDWNYYTNGLLNFTFIYYSIFFVFTLSMKVQFLLFVLVWIRVAFPRYRYDQLMLLGWNFILPTVLFFFELATLHALWLKRCFFANPLLARTYNISFKTSSLLNSKDFKLMAFLFSTPFNDFFTNVASLRHSTYFYLFNSYLLNFFSFLNYNYKNNLNYDSITYFNVFYFFKSIINSFIDVKMNFNSFFLFNFKIIFIGRRILVSNSFSYISLYEDFFWFYEFMNLYNFYFRRSRPHLSYIYFTFMMDEFIAPYNFFIKGVNNSSLYISYLLKFFVLQKVNFHNYNFSLFQGLKFIHEKHISIYKKNYSPLFFLHIVREIRCREYPYMVGYSMYTWLIQHIVCHPFVILNDRGLYEKNFNVFNQEFSDFPYQSEKLASPNTYNWYDTKKPYPCEKNWCDYNVYQKLEMLLDFEMEFRARNFLILRLLAECLQMRFFKYSLYYFLRGPFGEAFFFGAHTQMFHLVKFCLYVVTQFDSFDVLHKYKDFLDQYKIHQDNGEKFYYDDHELSLWLHLVNDYCDDIAKRLSIIRFRVYSGEFFFFSLMISHDMCYKGVDLNNRWEWHFPFPRKSILIHGSEHLSIVQHADEVAQLAIGNWPRTRSEWKDLLRFNFFVYNKLDFDMPPMPPLKPYNVWTFWFRPSWHAHTLLPLFPKEVDFLPPYRSYVVQPVYLDSFNDVFIIRNIDLVRFWSDTDLVFDLKNYEFSHKRFKPVDNTRVLYWLYSKNGLFKTIDFDDPYDDETAFLIYKNNFRFFSILEEKKKIFDIEWSENLEQNLDHRWSEDVYSDFLKDDKNLKENDMDYEKLKAFKYYDDKNGKMLDIFETLKINNVSIPTYELVFWHKYAYFFFYLKFFNDMSNSNFKFLFDLNLKRNDYITSIKYFTVSEIEMEDGTFETLIGSDYKMYDHSYNYNYNHEDIYSISSIYKIKCSENISLWQKLQVYVKIFILFFNPGNYEYKKLSLSWNIIFSTYKYKVISYIHNHNRIAVPISHLPIMDTTIITSGDKEITKKIWEAVSARAGLKKRLLSIPKATFGVKDSDAYLRSVLNEKKNDIKMMGVSDFSNIVFFKQDNSFIFSQDLIRVGKKIYSPMFPINKIEKEKYFYSLSSFTNTLSQWLALDKPIKKPFVEILTYFKNPPGLNHMHLSNLFLISNCIYAPLKFDNMVLVNVLKMFTKYHAFTDNDKNLAACKLYTDSHINFYNEMVSQSSKISKNEVNSFNLNRTEYNALSWNFKLRANASVSKNFDLDSADVLYFREYRLAFDFHYSQLVHTWAKYKAFDYIHRQLLADIKNESLIEFKEFYFKNMDKKVDIKAHIASLSKECRKNFIAAHKGLVKLWNNFIDNCYVNAWYMRKLLKRGGAAHQTELDVYKQCTYYPLKYFTAATYSKLRLILQNVKNVDSVLLGGYFGQRPKFESMMTRVLTFCYENNISVSHYKDPCTFLSFKPGNSLGIKTFNQLWNLQYKLADLFSYLHRRDSKMSEDCYTFFTLNIFKFLKAPYVFSWKYWLDFAVWNKMSNTVTTIFFKEWAKTNSLLDLDFDLKTETEKYDLIEKKNCDKFLEFQEVRNKKVIEFFNNPGWFEIVKISEKKKSIMFENLPIPLSDKPSVVNSLTYLPKSILNAINKYQYDCSKDFTSKGEKILFFYSSFETEDIKNNEKKINLFFIENFLFFLNIDLLHLHLTQAGENKDQILLILVNYIHGDYIFDKQNLKFFSSRKILNFAYCLSLFCDSWIRLEDIYIRAYHLEKINYNNASGQVVISQILSCHAIWLSWFKILELFKELSLKDDNIKMHQISQVLRILINKYNKLFNLYFSKGHWPFFFFFSSHMQSYLYFISKVHSIHYIQNIDKYFQDDTLKFVAQKCYSMFSSGILLDLDRDKKFNDFLFFFEER